MKKFLIEHRVSILLIFSVVTLLFFVYQVSAQVPATGGAAVGTSRSLSADKGRLEVNKLRLCKIRERNIINRSNSMVAHAHRLVQFFDSIATRVENYYSSKLVPSGKTLPNYDALVADIKVNKDAITRLLQVVQSDAANFKCEGDDPKGQLDKFREDMHAVITGLKTYRISVRNLTVAVSTLKRSETVTSVTP